MLNYYEYLNLNGLSFKIGFDRETDTEFDSDFKIVFGVDYCDMPVFYDYWGQQMSFVGEL